MAGFRLHRSEARRYTAMAQVGAGVLLAGAFAAYALLPVPGKVEPLPVKDPGLGSGEREQVGPAMDFEATALALKNWDAKPAPSEHPDNPDSTPTQPIPPTAEAEWKYLGAIVEPTRLVAIVEADGGQHLMTVGSTLGELKVLEVRADAIVVADGNSKRTIDLMERSGAVIGMAGAGGSPAVSLEGEPDGEMDPDMADPRMMERRGPAKRPTPPNAKNMPRPASRAPAGTSSRPRPKAPDGT